MQEIYVIVAIVMLNFSIDFILIIALNPKLASKKIKENILNDPAFIHNMIEDMTNEIMRKSYGETDKDGNHIEYSLLDKILIPYISQIPKSIMENLNAERARFAHEADASLGAGGDALMEENPQMAMLLSMIPRKYQTILRALYTIQKKKGETSKDSEYSY